MDSIVTQIVRLKLECQQLIEDLSITLQQQQVPDSSSNNSNNVVVNLENNCSSKLLELDEALETFRIKLSKTTQDVRETYKPKYDQLKFDADGVKQGYQAVLRRRQEVERQSRDREELFAVGKAKSVDTTAIFIDQEELEHHTKLQRANGGVDKLISQGAGILSDLNEQRETLKRVQRRMFDIGNRLGLSNTVMRLIEQRTTQDKFFLFGGMIVASLIMFGMWYCFG